MVDVQTNPALRTGVSPIMETTSTRQPENSAANNRAETSSTPAPLAALIQGLDWKVEAATYRLKGDGDEPKQISLDQLKDLGFATLSQKLAGRDGFPWNKIRRVNNPALMEQLVDLTDVCFSKAGGLLGEQHRYLIDHCVDRVLDLQKGSPAHVSMFGDIDISREKAFLGKMMFLADRDLDEVVRLMTFYPDKMAQKEMTSWFNGLMDTVLEEIEGHHQAHKKHRLQDVDRVKGASTPLAIARLLVTSTGSVNTGLISSIRVLLDPATQQLPYGQEIMHILSSLEHNPVLKEKLEGIVAPKGWDNPSHIVVRTTLGMGPDEEVSDLDAKVAGLSALMWHVRQGYVGSCFATFLAIELQDMRVGDVIDDLRALIRDGYMVREVDGAPMKFPYLLRMSAEVLDESFVVNGNGKSLDAPGLQAAFQAIGLTNPKQQVLDILGMEYSWNLHFTTVRKLLKEVALHMAGDDNEKANEIYNTAVLAFNAQEDNPLARVWEYTLCSMAEGTASSFVKAEDMDMTSIKGRTINSMVTAARETLLEFFNWDIPVRLEKKFKEHFCDVLLSYMHYYYDPDYQHSTLSADGNSSAGAFVMGAKGSDDTPFTDWKIVDDPEKFKKFAQHCLYHTIESMKNDVDFTPGSVDLEELRFFLEDEMGTDGFVRAVFKEYSYGNGWADVIYDYDRIDHAPWVDKRGHDPVQVIRTYFESQQDCADMKVYPYTAEELLTKVLEYMGKNGQAMDNEDQVLVPMMSPQHAFSFLIQHPSMRELYQGTTSVKGWIKEHVIRPGRELANSMVEPATFTRMMSFCQENYSLEMDEKSVEKMSVESSSMTIRQFRDKVVDMLGQKYNHFHMKLRSQKDDEESPYDKMVREVDEFIVKNLPQFQSSWLGESALHFADTNWYTGANDLHFCFVVNPGSGALELWRVNDQGLDMRVMSQWGWINGGPWEIWRGDVVPPQDYAIRA